MDLRNCGGGCFRLIVAIVGFVWGLEVFATSPQTRLVFTGDIMMSREVEREITHKNGASPWVQFKNYFSHADWVMGNLEGSVGAPKSCIDKGSSLCFATPPQSLLLLKEAGFTSIGVENNHSADLGDSGREKTRSTLTSMGLSAVTFDDSPGFFRSNEHTFAFIALTNVPGKDGKKVEIPSNLLRQKIRLAKALANWVVVYVHWGVELTDWAQPKQREMAEWLVSQGVDLIVGHHPHVAQNAECINGKPVFFSLGNHVFDQKYPNTKNGMMAECFVNQGVLSCKGVQTRTPTDSAFPTLASDQKTGAAPNDQVIANCKVQASSVLQIKGYSIRPKLAEHQFVDGDVVLEGRKSSEKTWSVVAKHILSLEPGKLKTNGKENEFLLTIEKHRSSIDQEDGPRPYVYEVTPHGLVAKWRGSALAWPLIDGTLLRGDSGNDYLCALHRKDSFLLLNPTSTQTRTAVYDWNGFGFSGVKDAALTAKCQSAFN